MIHCPKCERKFPLSAFSRPRRIFDPNLGARTFRVHIACGTAVLDGVRIMAMT